MLNATELERRDRLAALIRTELQLALADLYTHVPIPDGLRMQDAFDIARAEWPGLRTSAIGRADGGRLCIEVPRGAAADRFRETIFAASCAA